MNHLLSDDQEYYFYISEKLEKDRCFILIIYDIADNRRRTKLSKFLEGYGKRVQKSAFEAILTIRKYDKLVKEIPAYLKMEEDNVRIYRITGQGKVKTWGESPVFDEDVILI